MSLLPSGEQGEGSASEKVCAYFVASLVVHIREKKLCTCARQVLEVLV